MTVLTFQALGTEWSIDIDAELQVKALPKLEKLLLTQTTSFEHQFSRFIEGSEVTQWRVAAAGTYSVSAQMVELLSIAEKLRGLTDGYFDPAVGGLLEVIGYDPSYSLIPDEAKIDSWKTPIWTLNTTQQTITVNGPIIFDLGGIAKGYWIDQLSQLLLEQGYSHHLVEGGGDIMATDKEDGSSWKVALAWPGQPDQVMGQVWLKNQGLAASDISQRSWGKWHHLLNIKEKTPTAQFIGCATIAASAAAADQMTSVLALTHSTLWPTAAAQLSAEYMVLNHDQTATTSQRWSGELF